MSASSTSREETKKIAELNDALRQTFTGGKIMMTAGVNALSPDIVAEVLMRVRTFDTFNPDNDPHHEHDFGDFEVAGQKFFWKIDYYDKEMSCGSENPADPAVTTRVMTIMLAAEY